jgi:aldose 1-epimerase
MANDDGSGIHVASDTPQISNLPSHSEWGFRGNPRNLAPIVLRCTRLLQSLGPTDVRAVIPPESTSDRQIPCLSEILPVGSSLSGNAKVRQYIVSYTCINMAAPQTSSFGSRDGESVASTTIACPDGSTSATLITHGSAIHDLRVPVGGSDTARSVILGFDEPEGYFANPQWHHGAVAGRVANRVAQGKFSIDGKDYQLSVNEPTGHTCHGGKAGLGHRVWEIVDRTEQSVTFEIVSANGDQGFPGTVTARVKYSLPSRGVIRLEYTATTDQTTPISLTNHAFFNLDGASGEHINNTEQQCLVIHADQITAVDKDLIPTGDYTEVRDTPYDFRTSRSMRFIDSETGKPFHYDTNFVLRDPSSSGKLTLAAEMTSTNGDLKMECWTDQPGIQLFDGAPMDIPNRGLGGAKLGYRAGICLEAQLFPDWIHHPQFAQSIVKPGDTYRQCTEYRFF